MKRTRPEQDPTPLGATEFAAVLNGEDPRAILNILKGFVRTVRKERRLALAVQEKNAAESSHGSNSSDEEEENELKQTKRFRKDESWKEDTAEYNVPFVGTSFAKGDTGRVVVGSWPTGLLQAYLQKSPLAVELTGENLIPGQGHIHKTLIWNKLGKLSHKIYEAYLQALTELITAAIPIDTLRREFANDYNVNNPASTKDDNASFRFVGEILRKRLPGLLTLLKEETASGKGKAGVVGGCGPLAPFVLQILASLSLTSVQTARYVVRSLEQSLPEGVLRFVLRPKVSDDREATTPREDARVAAIHLAAVLIEQTDNIVLSCIATPGIRDQKIHPGLLYLAFKEGLSDTFDGSLDLEPSKFHTLLRAIRRLLSSYQCHVLDRQELLSRRASIELLSRDAIQNFCEITSYAPTLSEETPFTSVLAANDQYNTTSDMALSGVEARRLLFVLLSDPERSPLLQSLQEDGKWSYAKSNEQQLVRVMNLLLESHGGLEIQLFVRHCVVVTPKLLPTFFRAVSFPDSRKVFAFVNRINFIGKLLHYGPSVWSCIKDSADSMEKSIVDDAMLALVPTGLRKHPLSKALQSTNPFLVSETLKCINFVVQRFLNMLEESPSAMDASSRDELGAALVSWLPDMQVILATLHRFDLSHSPAFAVVFGRAIDTIRSLIAAWPEVIRFDWVKILPSDAVKFCRSPLYIQMKTLKTLHQSICLQKEIPSIQQSSLHILLEIVLSCMSASTYFEAREIVLRLLCRSFSSGIADEECIQSLRYEFSCWFDGMTLATMDEFCNIVQGASQASLHNLFIMGRAWEQAGMRGPVPFLPVSSILVQALKRGSRLSKPFTLLTCQVAARCLLYHHDPIPLAVLLAYGLDGERDTCNNSGEWDAGQSYNTDLSAYALSLIKRDSPQGQKRVYLFRDMLQSLYSSGSLPNRVISTETFVSSRSSPRLSIAPCSMVREDVLSLFRLLFHLSIAHYESEDCARYIRSLRWLLPVVLEMSNGCGGGTFLRHVVDVFNQNFPGDTEVLTLLLLSSGQQKGLSASLVPLPKCFDPYVLKSVELRLFLFFFVASPFLPIDSLIACLEELFGLGWSECQGIAGRICTLQKYLILLNRLLDGHEAENADFVDSLFRAWWSIPLDLGHGSSSGEVAPDLERVLCKILSHDSVELSTALCHSLVSVPPEQIVKKCLQSKMRIAKPSESSPSDCFLAALIGSDFVRYAPVFLKQLSGDENRRTVEALFERGSLESAILVVCERQANVKEQRRVFGFIAEKLIGRVIDALVTRKKSSEDLDKVMSIIISTDIGTIRQLPECKIGELAAGLTENLISEVGSMDGNDVFRVSLSTKSVQLALFLCKAMADFDLKPTRKLASAALFRLSHLVSISLKHSGEKEVQGKDENSNQAIDWICELLESVERFDNKLFFRTGSSFLSELIRTCLKNSLSLETAEIRVPRSLCLRLVQRLVLTTRKSFSLESLGSALKKPLSWQVFEMITTHSRFGAAVASRETDNESDARLELIRLIRCCLSVDEEIEFDGAVWRTLQEGYGASMTESDMALRQVLIMYQLRASGDSDITFFDELRWSETASVRKSEIGWDWLADGISLHRIRETIRNFPINDKLDPLSTEDVSSPGSAYNNVRDTRGPRASGPSKISFTDRSERLGLSYSPGFILPLILGALEGAAEQQVQGDDLLPENSRSNMRDNSEQTTAKGRSVSTACFAQRLCEKGCLALALAALCSRCESIRAVALSVLRHLKKTVDSDEARQATSWRERPQLAMILNSVQRALVIRRANYTLSEGETPLAEPEVPGPPAIFLAKASLVLTKTSDSMFAAINRFFLKIETEHGAFQDLNRLPAFIAFFCSSAEDPGQVSRERVWAVELIRDGLVSKDCFRSIAACHAPELLVTAVDTFRCRLADGDDKEVSLLLSTLTKMITNGGPRAASNLIDRQGLLSWIRSILSGRPILELLPSLSSRVLFIELATKAVQEAVYALSRNDLLAAVAGIADSAITVCLKSVDDKYQGVLQNHDRYDSTPPIISSTCELLSSLQAAMSTGVQVDAQSTFDSHVQADGILLEHAYSFVSLLEDAEEESATILALCCLPVQPEIPSTGNFGAPFCRNIIDSLMRCGSNDVVLTQAVLERIRLCSTMLGSAFDEEGTIFQRVCLWRVHCCKSKTTRDAWYQCVSELVQQSDDDTELVRIAQQLINDSS